MIYKLCNKQVILLIIFILASGNINLFAIDDVKDLKEVGIKEQLGNKIPDRLQFYNTQNEVVQFSDFFLEEKPVVLNLVYFSCPRLCNYAINGVVDVLNNLSSINLGRDFKVLTISFNSEETVKDYASRINNYFKLLDKEHFPKGNWHFLSGDSENIAKLTKAVGFNYKKDGDEFAHPSTLIIITPDKKVSRYLYGIQQDAKDLKLALLEATDGEIGTSKLINKVLLFCYQFDPIGKKYALQALNVVKAGGVITLLGLGIFLTYFWRREKKISRKDGGLNNTK